METRAYLDKFGLRPATAIEGDDSNSTAESEERRTERMDVQDLIVEPMHDQEPFPSIFGNKAPSPASKRGSTKEAWHGSHDVPMAHQSRSSTTGSPGAESLTNVKAYHSRTSTKGSPRQQDHFPARPMPLVEVPRPPSTKPPEAKEAKPCDSKLDSRALELPNGKWLEAMKKVPQLAEHIQPYDEPVLKYLACISRSYLDRSNVRLGFRLKFRFRKNNYFENEVLYKEYRTEENYLDIRCKEIIGTKIAWFPQKDTTIQESGNYVFQNLRETEKKEVPRKSFFRMFFRDLHRDMQTIPDCVTNVEVVQIRALTGFLGSGATIASDKDVLKWLIQQDYELGTSVHDHLVPKVALQISTASSWEEAQKLQLDQEAQAVLAAVERKAENKRRCKWQLMSFAAGCCCLGGFIAVGVFFLAKHVVGQS